ncbi:MAG: hypothetical protein ACXAEU_18200 [Candidatus Hodarchaeales archaeon]
MKFNIDILQKIDNKIFFWTLKRDYRPDSKKMVFQGDFFSGFEIPIFTAFQSQLLEKVINCLEQRSGQR